MGCGYCDLIRFFSVHIFSLCNLSYIFFLVDLIGNTNLKNFVLKRLRLEFEDKIFHPCGQDFWILDLEKQEWYFQVSSGGVLQYNRKFFEDFFYLFYFQRQSYEKFLRFWVENVFEIKINSVSRRNFDFKFFFDWIVYTSSKKWTLNNRFGFSFGQVRKYLKLIEENSVENLKLKVFFEKSEVYNISNSVDRK
jgi:hypothetical protein